MFHMSVSLNSSQKSELCNCLYQFRQGAFYFKVWSFGFIVWSVFFIVGTLNSSHLSVVAVCTNGIRLCSTILISLQKEFVNIIGCQCQYCQWNPILSQCSLTRERQRQYRQWETNVGPIHSCCLGYIHLRCIKRILTLNQKLACFVLYLKNFQHIKKKYMCIL